MYDNFVFFFKQKTAYEVRISDWSSDVCSSDLWLGRLSPSRPALAIAPWRSSLPSANTGNFSHSLIDRSKLSRRGRGSSVASARMTIGACSPFEPCTVITRTTSLRASIGRASCRERVCSVRVDLGGRRIIKKKKKKNKKTTQN